MRISDWSSDVCSSDLLDIPVGPTAKVRSVEAAKVLSTRLAVVADAFGLRMAIVQTDGTQPVGRGIGPSLEAREVLAVLQQRTEERRVGNGCVSTCRSWRAPYH